MGYLSLVWRAASLFGRIERGKEVHPYVYIHIVDKEASKFLVLTKTFIKITLLSCTISFLVMLDQILIPYTLYFHLAFATYTLEIKHPLAIVLNHKVFQFYRKKNQGRFGRTIV